MPDDGKLVSLSGQPIIRYGERRKPLEPDASVADMDAIEAHIERHVGPIDTVLHEKVSDLVHIDVHHVLPSADRPFHVLVTAGMSARPMSPPPAARHCRYAELVVALPAEWPFSPEAFKREEHYWPVKVARDLARFPHVHDTWLWWGHTVDNGDPPVPYAPDIGFVTTLLASPASLPEEFQHLEVSPTQGISFFALMPLYAEEKDYKLRAGARALLKRLVSAGVDDLVCVGRANVCRRPQP